MMDFSAFPLNIQSVFFTKLHIEAIPGHVFSPSYLEAPARNSLAVEKKEGEENIYMVMMTTKLNEEKSSDSPYFIDAQCIVCFYVDPSLSDEERAKALHITGHNVAYGALREAIGWISGRGPYGPLTLGLSVLKPSNQKQE